ncbi:hypothetical protein B7P43_G19200 [Cryptotermes secundus]|uniref:Uncharacterized protein n=2 Tax=Cryptotermes secundus TaxID=105785 RepID=A0A2J7QG55_9NEOP|nr:hypothetical protein B7P43_G19200 [Cryptotermes secundus]
MKFDMTVFTLLSAATLTLSFCPQHVFTLLDKFYLQYDHPNQSSDRTESNAFDVTGRDMGNEPHKRHARCLEWFEWLFDLLEPEYTSEATTTVATSTPPATTTTTGKTVTSQSTETTPTITSSTTEKQ